MVKKKADEVEEITDGAETEISEETAVEAQAAGEEVNEATVAESTIAADETVSSEAAPAEKKTRKPAAKKADASDDTTSAKASSANTTTKPALASSDSESGTSHATNGKRAEKIGVVASDKMTKTVTVRVDRLVKHPVYRKYVRKRKKFMAHDELGSKVGDKVRIIETRPLSARKRWRVVEIIQKAER